MPHIELCWIDIDRLELDDGWNAPGDTSRTRFSIDELEAIAIADLGAIDELGTTQESILMMSIVARGFDPHSPLLVAREGERRIVVDGARRLRAARRIVGMGTKLARELGLTRKRMERLGKGLETLPCLVTRDREAARASALGGHTGAMRPRWSVRKICEGTATQMEAGLREREIEHRLAIGRSRVRLDALTALVMRHARAVAPEPARRVDESRWDALRAALAHEEVRLYLGLERPLVRATMVEEVETIAVEKLREVLVHAGAWEQGLAHWIVDDSWGYAGALGDPDARERLRAGRHWKARQVGIMDIKAPRTERTIAERGCREDAEWPPWTPRKLYGWTWIMTMDGSPETYSLLDDDGELVGCVYQRWNRVICWAPYAWGEEAYRSEDDVGDHGFEGDAQRHRHLCEIGRALRVWVEDKKAKGVDLVMLRDEHAYYFEARNGHASAVIEELEWHKRPDWRTSEEEAAAECQAMHIDGWKVVRCHSWNCEGYRVRDETGQMRGHLQVRYGVVRAVAATKEDADAVDPMTQEDRPEERGRTCRGQIVLQEKTTPMANAFDGDERELWIRRCVAAIAATPCPDRSWPASTLGAWGTPGQRMFPTSRRNWK